MGTLGMYGAAIAAFALLIAYYTGEYSGQCKLHEFFASINLIICVALSVVSILPKVQEHMPQSSLLDSFQAQTQQWRQAPPPRPLPPAQMARLTPTSPPSPWSALLSGSSACSTRPSQPRDREPSSQEETGCF